MKKIPFVAICMFLLLLQSCQQKNSRPSKELINEMNLKRGAIITCGSSDVQFGNAEFEVSCNENSKSDFNLGVKLLHSFEYDEAEKAFSKVADTDPTCAMAYWGIAMANFHPLWTPPSEKELKKGAIAVQIAKSLKTSKREGAYIDAIASFYDNWDKIDHRTRCLNFEKGMENVYNNNPEDKEAAVFYALSLTAAADANDKSFTKQKKAGDILNALYPGQPNHPGIVHYLIHTYDYPELAQEGLPAAKSYASIAPSSAHALHMPSHIFTRLGYWDDCIRSNMASVSSAKCYAVAAGMNGHWDEELHGLDYLVYAYLQKGENDLAKKQWDYLNSMREIFPVNFKVAYAFAAIPSRYLLENSLWKEAAALEVTPALVPWKNFPWQESIIHYTCLLGNVNTGNLPAASESLKQLNRLHDTLVNQKDAYKANQVAIQIKASEAWIRLKEGKNSEALNLMQSAADMEDKTEKHPVTPSEVLPTKELLGNMLMQLNKPKEALMVYEANLKVRPNRFNSLYGAGVAAQKSGNAQLATSYFQQLVTMVSDAKTNRPELNEAKAYLKNRSLL